MRKRLYQSMPRRQLILLLVLTLSLVALSTGKAEAGGVVTVEPGVMFKTIGGNFTQLTPMTVNQINMPGTSAQWDINVASLENTEPGGSTLYGIFPAKTIVWNVSINSPSSSATFSVTGRQPTTVICKCARQYLTGAIPPLELITFAQGTYWAGPMIVSWSDIPLFSQVESQKVLFIDDFLYTNPLAQNLWTFDAYQSPKTSLGISTSSGYLVMRAQTTSPTETVHVSQPIFTPSQYSDGQIVKRKLTASFYPFAKSASMRNAALKIGFSPLISTGVYPGNNPAGSPSMIGDGCNSSPTASDNIGGEYLYFANDGYAEADICGDPSGTKIYTQLLSGVDPTLYTVATVETQAIFCSHCMDNVYPGSEWVWIRVYQRDSNSNIVVDQNHNFTLVSASYFQKEYVLVTQENTDSAASGQVSRIDLVQVQNYGSPVCLNVPGGVLCTNLPKIPSTLGSGVISDIAWLANQIGFGDPQIGAIIIFLVMMGGFSFLPLIFTRNYLVAGEGAMIVVAFFVYAGFFPAFVIFIPILVGAVLTVMLVNRLVGGHGLTGSGGGGAE